MCVKNKSFTYYNEYIESVILLKERVKNTLFIKYCTSYSRNEEKQVEGEKNLPHFGKSLSERILFRASR